MKTANVLKHAAKLMASGFVAAIGFILLAKGTFFEVEQTITNTFFTLLAVQLLAVTASVLGADRKTISALSTLNEATSIQLSKTFYAWIAIIALTTFTLLITNYNTTTEVSLIICASVILDTLSTIKQAELSAKLKTNAILISNIIRYPLFFALLFIAGEASKPTTETVFALFLAASALRLAIINWPPPPTTTKLVIKPDFHLGSFQLFNYSINRGAQTLIGASILSIGEDNQSLLFLSWKIIEIIDKTIITLIPLFLNITLKSDKKISALITISTSLASSSLFILITATTSTLLTSLSSTYITWLAIHSALIYPSNMLFLLTLRDSGSRETLKASAIALTSSTMALTILSTLNESLLGLVIYTPIGLFTMILIMTWSRKNKKQQIIKT